jgi:predicted AlkP superfamily pyrophosphatase or phosphodiesterase
MPIICRGFWVAACAGALLAATGTAADAVAKMKKVLLIGIDGCRFDALQAADTPHLDALLEHGAVARPIRIFPARYREADTVSGPGWSSILTGVWADKHGVLDNAFKSPRYDKYPHFFTLLKRAQPDAQTASLVDWAPIRDEITSSADVNPEFAIDQDAPGDAAYATADAAITKAATKLLAEGDAAATFVYLGQVDETGHADGFHPSVATYVAAIERVDAAVGTLFDAIQRRPTYAAEDWLVLVTADHGGQGTGHGGGHADPDVAASFLIVSGDSAVRGTIDQECGLVDVAPTALTHLGVKLDPAWELDGRAVGLRSPAAVGK